ncbi:hypothetical protein [Clostridium cellulovorans]
MKFKELWTKETFTCENEELSVKIPAHGAKLYKY